MAGEGEPTPTPSPTPTPTPTPPAPDPTEGYKKLLEKHGNDALRVAELLYGENHKHRETIRELKAKIPAEGAVVLAGDELKAFEALKGLGKTPAEIQQALYDNEEFKASDARRQTEGRRKEWAELVGYDPDVLGKLLDDDEDIEIEVQDVPAPQGGSQKGRDGKVLRAPYVKTEDPKDKRKSIFVHLNDYAQKTWPKFLPALKASSGPPARPNGSPAPQNGPPPPAPPNRGGASGQGSGKRFYGGKSPF